jgi:uncharacterized protein YndB with AHSA1/START domain
MATQEIRASKQIQAAPEKIYAMIADYHNGHPHILPKPYFVALEVEKGGYGAGTVIRFQMKLMGRLQKFRAEITEPEPGRVLVETDLDTGTTTTFTVEEHAQAQESLVSIRTVTQVRDGLFGAVEGWLTVRLLQPIYTKELDQLASVAEK